MILARYYANLVDHAGTRRIYDYDRDSWQFAPTGAADGQIIRNGGEVVLTLGDEVAKFLADGTIIAKGFTNYFPGNLPRVELVREFEGQPFIFGAFSADGVYAPKFEDAALPPFSTDRLNLTPASAWNAAKLVCQGFESEGFSSVIHRVARIRGRACIDLGEVLAANDGYLAANDGYLAVSRPPPRFNRILSGRAAVDGFGIEDLPGLVGWYRPESLPTIGEPVTSWPDSSGQDNHMVADVNVVSATTGLSGYRAAQFSNSSLRAASDLTVRTVFIVVRFDNITMDGSALLGHGTHYHWHGGHQGTEDQDHVLNSTYTHANVTGGEAWLNGATIDPLSIIKPVEFALLEFSCVGDTTVDRLGDDRSFYGVPYSIVELILGNQALSSPNQTAARNLLLTKYSL